METPLTTPDILPTLLGLVGITPPDSLEGEDLSDLLRHGAPATDRAALYMGVAPFAGKGFDKEYRAIRTSRYTYVRALDGPWLLFDDRRDPCQLDNLADQPEFAALRSELDGRLQAELKRIGDDFRPAEYYVKAWGYELAPHGSVSYARTPKFNRRRGNTLNSSAQAVVYGEKMNITTSLTRATIAATVLLAPLDDPYAAPPATIPVESPSRGTAPMAASPLVLWYRQPARAWEEALPVGNGQMGAMVFGGVASERIQFNEHTVWTGQPHDYAHEAR